MVLQLIHLFFRIQELVWISKHIPSSQIIRLSLRVSEFGFKEPKSLNIGAWLDEYLGDAALVNTLRFRLATRNSKMLLGFTPIDGYTPFVAEYLKGAETLKTRRAELLGRDVPVQQYSPERDAGIVYLHSDENPFGGYDRIAKDLKTASEDTIMVRAYGLPTKSMTSLVPNFSPEINVLSSEPNKYGASIPGQGVPYMVIR